MLLKPNFKFDKVTDISVEFLKSNHISALILDVDNTLSTHHGMKLTEGLEAWLQEMRDNSIKMVILSNSKENRVKPFAENLALDYISLGLKPLPFKFFTAVKKLDSNRRSTALVGDQLFTDSLGAHLAGVRSIILNPILPEDIFSFKIRRWIEKKLYSIYKF